MILRSAAAWVLRAGISLGVLLALGTPALRIWIFRESGDVSGWLGFATVVTWLLGMDLLAPIVRVLCGVNDNWELRECINVLAPMWLLKYGLTSLFLSICVHAAARTQLQSPADWVLAMISTVGIAAFLMSFYAVFPPEILYSWIASAEDRQRLEERRPALP